MESGDWESTRSTQRDWPTLGSRDTISYEERDGKSEADRQLPDRLRHGPWSRSSRLSSAGPRSLRLYGSPFLTLLAGPLLACLRSSLDASWHVFEAGREGHGRD